jgi:tRNA threonylcarbamoyl adenosine modification protein YjeE
MASQFVDINDQANSLYQRFLPGPVTVVSKDLGKVAPGVASEFGTLGIRISSHPLVSTIVAKFGQPITATSANASGKKKPYSLNDIFSRLSAKQLSLIDLAIDAGTLPPKPPSTVIDTTLSTPLVMRQGEISTHETTGQDQVVAEFTSHSPDETRQIAGKWLLKYWDQVKSTGLVIGLNGSLGAGKTVLTQGIGQFLKIPDQIISPTYNYILEYPFERHKVVGQLQHVDAWKIGDQNQYQQLNLAKLLKPGVVVIIEWWSLIHDYGLDLPTVGGFDPLAPILTIDLAVISQTQRNLTVKILRPGKSLSE